MTKLLNPQWLVSSNVLFFLAAFEVVHSVWTVGMTVPKFLIALALLTPLISCWYHAKEIREQTDGTNPNAPIPVDRGLTLTLCYCDMTIVITLAILGVLLLWEKQLCLSPFCLVAILVWYIARNSNWQGYIRLHSLWHILAGIVILHALYLLRMTSFVFKF